MFNQDQLQKKNCKKKNSNSRTYEITEQELSWLWRWGHNSVVRELAYHAWNPEFSLQHHRNLSWWHAFIIKRWWMWETEVLGHSQLHKTFKAWDSCDSCFKKKEKENNLLHIGKEVWNLSLIKFEGLRKPQELSRNITNKRPKISSTTVANQQLNYLLSLTINKDERKITELLQAFKEHLPRE